jgi:hypothetical protein
VREVERRARGMAEGLRAVLERSRDGARSLGELSTDDPRLRAALDRAGADRGRRIWFLGRSGRRLWPDETLCVAGCYETLAEAAALAACAGELRGLDEGRRLGIYEQIAEAQSALRKALRDLAGLQRCDEDRAALFDWLHDHVVDEGLYVRRHMRSSDPADPWAWRERRERLRSMRSALRGPLRLQRQVDELLGLVRYHAGKIPERHDAQDRWRDWSVIDQAVRWLAVLEQGDAVELLAALAPVALRVPDGLELSRELVDALDLARRPSPPPPARRGRGRTHDRVRRAQPTRSLQQMFEQAEQRHPQRLAFRPNNHSDRDYPYDRPDEVDAALRWLVGPYWEVRQGLLRADHRALDLKLRKACGWTYKTSQSASTVGRYRSWYETTYEGRRLVVLEHIGRGNTKRQGPHSIRIGFTWDEQTGKVVVGFVGQHQRNRDS